MNNLPDYENRRLAVTTFDKNIVVTAGAGTGKTTLLVDRIICLLMRPQDPLKITDIVALTFTNKAAGEMRSRLRKKLEGIISHGLKGLDSDENRMLTEIIDEFRLSDKDVRARAQGALDELEKAQICTMHSFAGFILRLYPLEAGIDPGFKEDDGSVFEEHFEREWEEWLEIELSLNSPHRQLWEIVLNQTSLESLKGFVRELCREAIPLDTIGKDSHGHYSNNEFRLWLELHLIKVQELLSAYPKLRKVERLLYKSKEVFESIILNRPPEILNDDMSLSAMPKDWSEGDSYEAVRIIRAAKRLSSADDTFFCHLSDLCLPFAVRCRERFTASGYISFDGLLSFCRDILKNRTEVREGIKSRFKAVLVDEFQDTDPVQYEIILYMGEVSGRHETEWHKVKLTPGKLFIVGDPKQSIYAFRKADIEAYSHVRELLLADNTGHKTDLSTNFRSNNRIIEVVNDLFSCMIKKRGLYQPEYVSLMNRPDNEAGLPAQGVELRLIDAGEKEDINAQKAVRLEAEAIGRWIKEEAIGKKEISGPDGKRVFISHGHIAILLRKMTDVNEYLEVMRRYDIPYMVEGEKHFYATQEVIDFVNLLRVIDNPGDSLAMAGVLRSPLGGLSDREIYEMNRLSLLDYRRTDETLTVERLADETLGDSLITLYRLLRRLKADVGAKPVSEAIHCIFETLPVLEFAASSYNGEQALANLIKIQKIAESLGDRADLTLKGFTALLEENVTGLQEEGESLLAEEAVNAVRILSIHKAKGLEFPVVILAGVHSYPKGGEDNISVIHDWSSNTTGLKIDNLRNRYAVMIYDKNTIKDEEEQKRLLYVAMTRARESLIISGTIYGNINRNCFMSMIQGVIGEYPGDKSADEIVLNRGRIKQVLINPDMLMENKRERGSEDSDKESIKMSRKAPVIDHKAVEGLACLWGARDSHYNDVTGKALFVSPTKMEEGFADSKRDSDKPGGFSLIRPDRGVLIGSAIHYLLQNWDFKNDRLFMQDNINEVISRFIPQPSGTELSSVKDEIKRIMDTFILSPAYNELKGVDILGREVPFTMSWDGQIMEGFIDVIFRDGRDGGRVYIGDYKTDRISGVDIDLTDKEREYAASGRIYIEAVRRCFGINAAGFKLIFVRPGKSILIKPKLSDFKTTEFTEKKF